MKGKRCVCLRVSLNSVQFSGLSSTENIRTCILCMYACMCVPFAVGTVVLARRTCVFSVAESLLDLIELRERDWQRDREGVGMRQ